MPLPLYAQLACWASSSYRLARQISTGGSLGGIFALWSAHGCQCRFETTSPPEISVATQTCLSHCFWLRVRRLFRFHCVRAIDPMESAQGALSHVSTSSALLHGATTGGFSSTNGLEGSGVKMTGSGAI